MRVLVAHNRYLQPGGEDVVVDSEVSLLRDLGWEVDLLETSNRRVAELGLLSTALRTSWSREAAAEVGERLASGEHDILHVHNWFPLLSPSIHWRARGRGVPVIQTLHNYRLACLGPSLHRGGRRCTDCVGRLPWPGVLHRCYRDSAAGSATLAGALALHRALGTWRRAVTVFVALSEFSRRMLVSSGLPAERTVVKPNFVHPDPGPGTGPRAFALFASRLTSAKGIDQLLAVWPRGGMPLEVAGSGELEAEVRQAAACRSEITYHGELTRSEILRRLGDAAFLVLPTRQAESCPVVVLEAFCRGTPVIATRESACEELVRHRENGLLVPLGDERALHAAVRELAGRPEEARRMGREARRTFEERFTRERNGVMLEAIYRRALASRQSAATEIGSLGAAE